MQEITKLQNCAVPKRIYLVGMMGCGKSYFGKLIAQQNNLSFIDTDSLIVQKYALSIEEIFSKFGEAFFREKERELIQKISLNSIFSIVSTGGGTPCFFDNIDTMNHSGLTIFINEKIDILAERLINAKTKRPLISKLDEDELKPYLTSKLEERIPFYSKAEITLSNEEITEKKLNEIVLNYLKKN